MNIQSKKNFSSEIFYKSKSSIISDLNLNEIMNGGSKSSLNLTLSTGK